MSVPSCRSIRLPDFDYTRPGAYFITICTADRACWFGDVVDGEMRVNAWGEIVQRTWDNLPNHFRQVALDQFIVMPNHVHGIIMLNDERRCGVGAKQGSSASPASVPPAIPVTNQGKAGESLALPLHGTVAGSLCAVVQNFKSVTTRKINKIRHTPAHPLWQRNYYEHVIRNDRDLAAIRDYIAGNPARWLDDDNHPERVIAQSRNSQNPLGF